LVPITFGRGFGADDEDYGAPKAVAIISHHLWRTRFASDPAVVGRTARFGQQPFVLVGVAPRGFVDAGRVTRTDVWMPLPAEALLRADLRFADPRGDAVTLLAGRLSPAATRASAAAELSALSRQFRSAAALPSAGIEAIDTRPISRWPPGFLGSKLPIQALLALTVILMLLLACTNAANLVGTCCGLSALADERADFAALSLWTQPIRSRRLCWSGRHPRPRCRRRDMDPGPPGHGCRSRDDAALRMIFARHPKPLQR
jgi:hypothetical protein